MNAIKPKPITNQNANEKRMINALMVVGLWHDIKERGGLDLTTGECGFTPGQNRRLLLARALLRNSKLYIFDEVEKGIDEESREIIIKLIYQLSKDMGRTVILISDDVETIKNADKIAVVNDHGIVEQGTHDELMKKQGEYYRLRTAQENI